MLDHVLGSLVVISLTRGAPGGHWRGHSHINPTSNPRQPHAIVGKDAKKRFQIFFRVLEGLRGEKREVQEGSRCQLQHCHGHRDLDMHPNGDFWLQSVPQVLRATSSGAPRHLKIIGFTEARRIISIFGWTVTEGVTEALQEAPGASQSGPGAPPGRAGRHLEGPSGLQSARKKI